MATSNIAQLIGVFCVLCALNTLSIPICMAESAGVNFGFNEFTRCNTSNILCVNDATISGHKVHLTNNTNVQVSNNTSGRIVYNQTIGISSIASFTTDIQFAMKYYNLSRDDQGGEGIAFFMASKEIATIARSADYYSGLPGNGYKLSPKMVGVEFYCYIYNCSIYTDVAGYLPSESYNKTYLNQTLNDGALWNSRIEYNDIEKYLQIFLTNASKTSMSQKDLVFAFPFDFSKYLPDNLVVGISASAQNSSQTHTILSWSFNTKAKTRKSSTKIIIVTIVGVFCCLAGALMIWKLFSIGKKRRLESRSRQTCENDEIEISMLVDQGPCRYKLEDLKAGTNNFSETQKLGQGGFGGVYKGVTGEANEVVAIKRISQGSRQGMKEFISEISIVSRVRHRNLVQLLGWCHEKGELLLVYEYMSNGSLDKHLFSKGASPPLQWSHRYRIALEIACGLLYLHEEWDQCIVHRDIKSSNVMLDGNFNAKLGDFGLARMLEHNRLSQTTIAAGTFGYLAPECVITGRTSPESDVYSFGAVALEIATGKRIVDERLQEHNMRLVEWVWDLYGQGKILEAADEKLNGEHEGAEMEQLIGIGLWCSHPDPLARPKIRQVVKLLKLEDRVPNLPQEIPVPTYAAFHGADFSVPSSFTMETSNALPSQSGNSSQVSS
ncbi:L-type lectin-domain containing receptor kinase IX.1-like [Cryptomeria japonica]|uniref:L-type lectin-domain containing receptor kinase IX.1-like n=1 Tax=Cryptomeria japonica TaxID=3369 RepID=UPI0027D9F76A|nr:L-type lectin-domain containing receptor kinase IX.1-like [Cryptomeria japonica]